MEITQLRSFLCVSDHGNITRAADALYLTQPAVTQHVRALERELGVRLFERTGRGVILTSSGRALEDYARRAISILDECVQVIGDMKSGATGRVVLGAGVTTSIFSLPAWLRVFREAHPGVDVAVRTGRSREIADLVLAREIDLGFITSPVEHPDLSTRELYEEEIVLVTDSGHPLAGRTVQPTELDSIPLILFPHGSGFRAYIDRVLAEAGISASVKMETDSAEAIKSFVEVGLGASLLPASAVEAEIGQGRLARMDVAELPTLTRKTSLIYRSDRYLSTSSGAFMAMLDRLYGDQ